MQQRHILLTFGLRSTIVHPGPGCTQDSWVFKIAKIAQNHAVYFENLFVPVYNYLVDFPENLCVVLK